MALTVGGVSTAPVAAQTAAAPAAKAVERWVDFGKAGDKIKIPGDKTSVFFLREPSAQATGAVNVYLNGEYLTSLLPGGFKQSPACTGSNAVSLGYRGVPSPYDAKHKPQYQLELEQGKTGYFAVVPAAGGVTLQPVPAETALPLLARLKEQTTALSRVDADNCQRRMSVPVSQTKQVKEAPLAQQI